MSNTLEAWVKVVPKFGDCGEVSRPLHDFVRSLAGLATRNGEQLEALFQTALETADRCADQRVRLSLFILRDLWRQGWEIKSDVSGLWIMPPAPHQLASMEKERVRLAHLQERDTRLREPATREFIHKMEQVRQGPEGWVSIFSLMRDGKELGERLRANATLSRGGEREAALAEVIKPYIQMVEPDSVCSLTGLRLTDIWRYFRSTWINPYNSTPGRRLWILIRDSAAANRPIIGIVGLTSSVVQLAPRDQWIGWDAKRFVQNLRERPTVLWAKWLEKSLKSLMADVYCRDFLQEGILEHLDFKRPRPEVILKLRKIAETSRAQHQLYPQSGEHKRAASSGTRKSWQLQAQTPLFRWKRADTLASLLEARAWLLAEGFAAPTRDNLRKLLATAKGRRAVELVLRHVKASHVGVDILDIAACGAVAPYNSILGGKLVALLATSPEILQYYQRRYSKTPSIIASSMAGRPICRRPRLVFLGTTSLFGVGSSQYNRLKLPAQKVGATSSESIVYERLGLTSGFGSFHFSVQTVKEIEILAAQSHRGRRVNSIFGEGVNPRLRKIREGLEELGFPSDAILKHGSPRIIYGVPLASNFRDVLIGKTARPKYLVPQNEPEMATRRIAEFWIARWLAGRIEREDVLQVVERNCKTHPIVHGARVVLPDLVEDDNP